MKRLERRQTIPQIVKSTRSNSYEFVMVENYQGMPTKKNTTGELIQVYTKMEISKGLIQGVKQARDNNLNILDDRCLLKIENNNEFIEIIGSYDKIREEVFHVKTHNRKIGY